MYIGEVCKCPENHLAAYLYIPIPSKYSIKYIYSGSCRVNKLENTRLGSPWHETTPLPLPPHPLKRPSGGTLTFVYERVVKTFFVFKLTKPFGQPGPASTSLPPYHGELLPQLPRLHPTRLLSPLPLPSGPAIGRLNHISNTWQVKKQPGPLNKSCSVRVLGARLVPIWGRQLG